MRASRASSGWWWFSMLAALLVCAAHPGSAAAAATGKPYSVNISPASVAAGSHTTFSATFSNPAGAQQQLGSANLSLPDGLVLRSASVAGPGTASVSGSTVVLRNLSLQPGSSVTVTVVADAACSSGVVTWGVLAKQANGFNGPPGNDLTLVAPSSLTTTISGQCKLQFATQPKNVRVGETITGTPYGPGPPVSVEVVDGAGARVTSPPARVTVARGPGSASAVLSGTTTVDTLLGVAGFPNLALSAPGTYTLEASSPGLASATSMTFRVATVAAFCTEDLSCSGTTSMGRTTAEMTALPAAGSGDAGFLTLSFNAGLAIDCAGYEEVSPDTALVDFSSPNRTKRATLTFDKKLMALTPNNGASFLEFCFGSPTPFLTKAGGLSAQQGSFDWDGDGTAEPVYAGLLPDCGAAAPPCVTARKKVGAGDGQISAAITAGLGAPGMRG